MADVYFDNSVRTDYLDPVSFVPGLRCRFELDGTKLAYLSNMRLLDIGVVSGATTNYNLGLGALALIKNIRLLDGRTELSALRNPAQYLFFKNANRSNAINKSNDSYLKRHGIGYEIDETDNKITNIYPSGSANTADNTTAKAYLDLREVFPILNTLRVLPTQLFQNLQVEIEFQPKEKQVLKDVSVAITPLRPVLAVDYISNDNLVNQEIESISKNGIVWDEIEWDSFVIPAVDTSLFTPTEVKTQNVSNHSLGFKGKYVERLLVCKQLQNIALGLDTNVEVGFGGIAPSQSLLNQTTQYRLNGKNVLPGFNGVTGENERLGMLSDEWGSTNGFPGSNLYQWYKNDFNNGLVGGAGSMSWDCVRLGARVADLVINISRVNNRDASPKAATNDGIVCNLYGEVKKAMALGASSSAGYRIIYA
tara:strand:+ start:2982 stop:4247 length:1266 start_codon:yes stop_codon:yes gene_type:complete